jgi:transposase-like protein
MRRSPKVAEVLPILYLRGLSTGDFREALPVLLGEDATGLSPTTITRLTAEWEHDYKAFRQRDLSERDYVYVWVADDVPQIRAGHGEREVVDVMRGCGGRGGGAGVSGCGDQRDPCADQER